MSGVGAAAARNARLVRSLRRGEFAALLVLLAQYLIGIVVNLFVKIPDHHPGSNPANYFGGVTASVAWAITRGGLWLALHAGLGLILVVISLGLIVQAARTEPRSHLALTIVAAVFVLGAGFNGGSFLNYGLDASSFIMAALWAVATACYVALLYLSGRDLAGRYEADRDRSGRDRPAR
ncbi:hypothetical protein CVV68_05820 [Arthrobacter livingstonensis]|uniref:DUF998 domain-containing protein n=1 Tax=Arthrobacter livingstonensis TaxID=670078 RepID=A0A2V5LMC2_9MICC|nr:hypothetical protein [Arthrobacter livingstonensis]PYI68800.1 hypothetical protein CVV68_05820 [Arthrobacter livingstonensis]